LFKGIFGALAGIISYFIPWSKVKEAFKQVDFTQFTKNNILRTNYKIAIIDDEIESFPIDFIRKMGFDVQCYESISFADSLEITKYDVVFLDVKGVVKEDLEEGGAKFIKILKQARSLLPIVAVSSGKFHPELNDYFKSSDMIINKPIDEFKISEILKELKSDYFDFPELINTLKEQIRKLPIEKKQKSQLEICIVKYLSTHTSKDEIMKFVHQIATVDSEQIIQTINIMKDRIDND
jgi:arsenate reductase-like glutaredoxin family protein